MHPPKDIAGQRFGRLVALSRLPAKDSRGSFMWQFLCDCGQSLTRPISAVTSKATRSCGCLKADMYKAQRKAK